MSKVWSKRPQSPEINHFWVNGHCCKALDDLEDGDIIKNQIGFGIDLELKLINFSSTLYLNGERAMQARW